MAELKDKILIVDDEIASRDELSTILKDEYEILEADTDESVMETHFRLCLLPEFHTHP